MQSKQQQQSRQLYVKTQLKAGTTIQSPFQPPEGCLNDPECQIIYFGGNGVSETDYFNPPQY